MDKHSVACGIYIMEYYSALRKKEAPSHVTTWMTLEDMTLSETSQSQKRQIPHGPTYMRYLESPNPHKQKVEWFLPEAGRRGKGGCPLLGGC